MGSIDRALRILLAVGLVVMYFSGIISGTIGILAIVVAVVFALTSLVSMCPLYSLLGIKTTKGQEAK